MNTTPIRPLPASIVTGLCLQYLFLLRAVIISGQLAAVFVSNYLLAVPPAGLPVAIVIAALTVLTLLSARFIKPGVPVSERMMLGQLSVDVFGMAALLLFAGGAANPFASLLLVPVIVAAALLRPVLTGCVAAESVLCYTVLMFTHVIPSNRVHPPPCERSWNDVTMLSGDVVGLFLRAGSLPLSSPRGRRLRVHDAIGPAANGPRGQSTGVLAALGRTALTCTAARQPWRSGQGGARAPGRSGARGPIGLLASRSSLQGLLQEGGAAVGAGRCRPSGAGRPLLEDLSGSGRAGSPSCLWPRVRGPLPSPRSRGSHARPRSECLAQRGGCRGLNFDLSALVLRALRFIWPMTEPDCRPSSKTTWRPFVTTNRPQGMDSGFISRRARCPPGGSDGGRSAGQRVRARISVASLPAASQRSRGMISEPFPPGSCSSLRLDLCVVLGEALAKPCFAVPHRA